VGTTIPGLTRGIALAGVILAMPGVAAAQNCDRLLDFETDHAGVAIEPGADLADTYAGWSVEIGAPDPSLAATAVLSPGKRGGLSAGGLSVHVVHFEDPFCVRSIDLLGFTGGQAAVVVQCFDGTSLPSIRAEDAGTLRFERLCGVGALRIEFWEPDAVASWGDLCLVRDDGTEPESLCGDIGPEQPPVLEFDPGPEPVEPEDVVEGCAECGGEAVIAWPGLLLLSLGFRRREF
jgi:uncharacterized protein (TIGR03382 family)